MLERIFNWLFSEPIANSSNECVKLSGSVPENSQIVSVSRASIFGR
jgi:hypothetical protein